MPDDNFSSRAARQMSLLTVGNPKTLKGTKRGYYTGILHLAPAWESGQNTCAAHTAECAANCLYFAGRGAMQRTQDARIRRTKMFFEDRATFLKLLNADINNLFYTALRQNYEVVFRLNGTSDIRWETFDIIANNSDCQFYDYTRIPNRKNIPPNYHLTFSWSGENIPACEQALASGINVSVPFLKKAPTKFMGHPVIDGDEDDLRFLTATGSIIALRAKGTLRKAPDSIFLGDNHPTLHG